MRDTSLQAYDSIQSKLSAKQREVMLAMHAIQKPVTRRLLARFLDWEINRLTGRVLELIEAGYLEECGTVVENGRSAHLVAVKQGQRELFS